MEGDAFHQQALQLLDAFEAVFNGFRPNLLTKNISGKLRIDVPIKIAKSILIPQLQNFKQQYPESELIDEVPKVLLLKDR